MKRKYLAIITAFVIVSILIFMIPNSETPIIIKKANVEFNIASWSYPDEYGQGIYQIKVEDNETGSWLPTPPDATRNYTESLEYNVSAGYALKLSIYSWLNSTLVGCSSMSEGQLYQRHNVTLRLWNGVVLFTQENFTYFNSYISGVMYHYAYYVILDFITELFTNYIAVISYEIYYATYE